MTTKKTEDEVTVGEALSLLLELACRGIVKAAWFALVVSGVIFMVTSAIPVPFFSDLEPVARLQLSAMISLIFLSYRIVYGRLT